MSHLSTHTAAPRTINVGGREFSASPLNFRQIGELEALAADWYLSRVRQIADRLGHDASAKMLEQAPEVAMRISGTVRPRLVECDETTIGAQRVEVPPKSAGDGPVVKWYKPDESHPDTQAHRAFIRFMGSLEGATRYMHLMVKRHHPELAVDELADLINNQAIADYAVRQLNAINQGESPSEGGAPGKP